MTALLLIVAENDTHVRISGKVVIVRVHNRTVVRKADVHLFKLLAEQGQRRRWLILSRRANFTARRMRWRRVQWRHTTQIEQIGIVRIDANVRRYREENVAKDSSHTGSQNGKKYPFFVTYLYLLGTPRHSAVPGNVFCSKTSPPRTKTFAADGAVGAVAVRCDAISSCDGANVSEVAA